jgi:tRNA threonylcarbamoyladenosine biosynthesis protein TsaB
VILALDTSSAISVALVDGDEVIAEASEYAPRSHAELLAPMVKSVLARGDAAGPAIERIVVGTGPAPFTGLRVGLVTARTLAFAWSVPMCGVCSLDALGAAAGGRVTVVSDARRKEVYWATYGDGVRTAGPFVGSPGGVKVEGSVVGRGAGLYPDTFAPDLAARGEFVDPDPAWLVRVATRLAAEGTTDFPTVPLYLRRPDVHGVPGA